MNNSVIICIDIMPMISMQHTAIEQSNNITLKQKMVPA